MYEKFNAIKMQQVDLRIKNMLLTTTQPLKNMEKKKTLTCKGQSYISKMKMEGTKSTNQTQIVVHDLQKRNNKEK